MKRMFVVAALGVALVGGWSPAQDTPRTKTTRENLKKIFLEDVEYKDEMTHVIFSDLARESNNKVSFIIDTNGGMSRNSRMSYKIKKASLEQILNELADKNDFGWYVYSNPKDPNDQKNGKVILRKGAKTKERGYESGTEPKKEEKKTSSVDPARWQLEAMAGARAMSHRISVSGRGGSRFGNFQMIPGR